MPRKPITLAAHLAAAMSRVGRRLTPEEREAAEAEYYATQPEIETMDTTVQLQHTPGPWKIIDTTNPATVPTDPHLSYIISESLTVVDYPEGAEHCRSVMVAEVGSPHLFAWHNKNGSHRFLSDAEKITQNEAAKANARLIAAAPELLAALRGLLRHCVTVDGVPDKGKGRTEEQQAAMDAARAAIAKATP
jgi:hypothetical protein